jgi:transposase InsO family protein
VNAHRGLTIERMVKLGGVSRSGFYRFDPCAQPGLDPHMELRDEFVFLAVILDAYSRRVIGWALDRTIEDSLTLTALRMALSHRTVGPGLVHHSDRGSQYASNDYTDLLKANGIDISMSRKGNPWDKAYASHCTSSAHCETISTASRLLDSLTPMAFRGGLSPGCS